MTFLMNLPAMHASSHDAQIDYLKTCWAIKIRISDLDAIENLASATFARELF